MRNSNYDTTQYDYRLVYICKIDEYNVEPEKETEKEPENEPEKRQELELEELTQVEAGVDPSTSFESSSVKWEWCEIDSDCADNHICVRSFIWTYDEEGN